MSEEMTEEKQSVAKYIYILVIFVGLIILGSTYVAYTYFNSPKNNLSPDEIADVEVTEIVPVTDDSDGFETQVLGLGQQNPDDGFGISEDSSNIITTTPVKGAATTGNTASISEVQLEETVPTDTSGISNARTWKANDYKFGDIKIGQYTVIYGDTLWELAEGAYGLGSKWIKIANVNTVDYFANGRPLIHVGQILTIPEDK